MGIDLISIGQHLHLLLGELCLVEIPLGMTEFLAHLILFIQHMVQIVHQNADFICPVKAFQAFCRRSCTMPHKSIYPANRTNNDEIAKIEEKTQPQKSNSHYQKN